MQSLVTVQRVRAILRGMFTETQESEPWMETLLIRDGIYCGRQFSFEGGRAVWFAEENVLKIYGGQGELLATQELTEAGGAGPARAA